MSSDYNQKGRQNVMSVLLVNHNISNNLGLRKSHKIARFIAHSDTKKEYMNNSIMVIQW